MRRRLLRTVAREAERVGLTRFWTLTCDSRIRSIGDDRERFKRLSEVWADFRKRMERRLGAKLNVLWVRERHGNGVPHLHFLTNAYLHHADVKEAWNDVGGGRIVWVERSQDVKAAARYLSKYLGKSIGREARPGESEDEKFSALPKRMRRYGACGTVDLTGIYPRREGGEPWGLEFLRGDVWRPVPGDVATFMRGWFATGGGAGPPSWPRRSRPPVVRQSRLGGA